MSILTRTLCVLALAFVTVAHAGTIEVKVKDEHGSPFYAVKLELKRVDLGTPRWFGTRRAVTDTDGRALFASVPAGQYRLAAADGSDAAYVHPDLNPLVTPTSVTLEADDQDVGAEMTLWRGIVVVSRVNVERANVSGALLRARELQFRRDVELPILFNQDLDVRLVPGLWQFEIIPPEGYLLIGLKADEVALEGHTADLELEPLMSARYVTWQLLVPAKISGKVAFGGAKEVDVEVEARLVEPGPWIDAVRKRGGSRYESVHASVFRERYSMVVPDGLWEVRAYGPDVESAEPEVETVRVEPGGYHTVNFSVTPKEGDDTGGFVVQVRRPDGSRLFGVTPSTVEVWPLNGEERGDQPLVRERAQYGIAIVRGLPAGGYFIVAGHPGFIEGYGQLDEYDPEVDKPPQVEVQLREGATVHVVAVDEDDRPVPGVDLSMERTGGADGPLITDPDLLTDLLHPRAETDATGHAWMRAVWPDHWELTGELNGPRSSGSFIRFDDGGERVERLDLKLADKSETEVAAHLVPAAEITARLACAGGEPLPQLIRVMAIGEDRDLIARAEDGFERIAEFLVEEQPLEGKLHDTLSVGPLEEGGYYLALRPMGFERWTWALGLEDPAEAAIIQVEPGDPIDVGSIALDCGPAIRLSPTVQSAAPLPDLREPRPLNRTLWVEGFVDGSGSGGKQPVRRPVVETYKDHVTLRSLPEGEAKLEIKLRNPYFLPGPDLIVRVDEPLERGRTVELTPVIADVGGSLLVRDNQGLAVRVIGPQGKTSEPVLASFADGEAFVPNLPAGLYDIDLCADEACDRFVRTWSDVPVSQLRNQELPQ